MASFVQKSALALNTSPTITGVTAGNFLVLTTEFGGTISGIVDTSGQTWSSCTINTNSGTGVSTQIWYLPNANAGTHTLTLTGASSQQSNIAEFSGILTASPIDGQTGSNGASATATAGPLTPSQSGDLFIAVMGEPGYTSNDGISDPPTGWTSIGAEQDGASWQGYEACYLINSGSGAETATWTFGYGVVGWTASIAAFKSSASSGSTTLTGVNSTSSTGQLTAYSVGASNGWPMAGMPSIGTLLAASSGNASISLSGISSTSSIGVVSEVGTATTTLFGILDNSGVGSVTASAGVSGSTTLTGVSSINGVGTVIATETTNAYLTGIGASSGVGSVQIEVDKAVILTGIGAVSSVGILSLEVDETTLLTGIGTTSYTGTLSAQVSVSTTLIGVPSSSSAGALSATGSTGGATYPLPSQVMAGVTYGPTGADYTGTYIGNLTIEVTTGALIKPLTSNLSILL